MKTKKIALVVFICLLMASVLSLVVACNKEIKLDLSDATQWGPAVAEGEEDIYRASNDSEGNLILDFAKNDTYNATRIMFAAFDVEELAKVKTLVVTAKMTTDAPYPALLFKVEGTDENFANVNVEALAKASEEFVTYEWDFGGYDLTKVTRFLIFADPGVAGSSGKITISEIYITDREMNPDHDATKMPPDVGVTPEPIWNEVTADKMSIGGWVDGTPNNVYTVTENADGTYTVDVHKKIGAGNWDALVSYVYGDALASAKSFKLVVRGTEGKQILVKPFDNFEKRVTLTGEEQEIIIDVSSFTADESKDYSKKDGPTAENKVVIMGVPDVNKGNDTFTIISATFSTEAADTPVVPDTDIVNEITSENRTANAAWYDSGDGVYTIEQDGTAFKVSFDKKGTEWSTMRAYVKGAALAEMKTLKVTISGTEGLQILVKPFDKVEGWVTLTGGEDEVVIDLSTVSGVDYTSKQPILIFGAPGVSGVTGEFRIINVEFSGEADTSIKTIEYGGDLNMGINNYWRDNGDGVWETSESEGVWTLAYAAGHSWGSATTRIALGDMVMNYLVVEVKSAAGQPVIIKFGDGNEVSVTGTGEFQKVTQKLSKDITGTIDVLVFAAWDDAEAGTVEIKSATLYYVGAIAGEGNLDANGAWKNAVKGDTRYTYDVADGSTETTISYSDNNNWNSILLWIDLGEGGFDTLTFAFKALAGHTAIININGTEYKWEGNEWDLGLLTGEEDAITMDVSAMTGLISIRIFLDFNATEANTAGGSFVITEVLFSKAA